MTKNNLHNCLGWLLQQQNLPNTTNLEYITPVPNEIDDSAFEGELSQLQNMARLQLAPQTSSSKPRLLSRSTTFNALPTPAASVVTTDSATPSVRSPTLSKKKTVLAPAKPPPTPVTDDGDSVFDIDEIDDAVIAEEQASSLSFNEFEELDEVEDHRLSVERDAQQKRGKKRNSEEFFEDIRSQKYIKSSQPHSARKRHATGINDEGLVENNECGHLCPSASPTSASISSTKKKGLGKQQATMRPPVQQPPTPLSNRTDEAVAGRSSKLEAPARKDKIRKSDKLQPPNGRHTSSVIADSDDEYMNEIPFVIASPPKPSSAAGPSLELNSTENVDARQNQPHKDMSPSRSRMLDTKAANHQINQSSRFIDRFPKVSHASSPIGANSSPIRTHETLDESQSALVTSFLHAATHELESFLQELETLKKSTGLKIATELCENDFISEELKSDREHVKRRILAFQEAISVREGLRELTSERDNLKLRLHQLVEDDHEFDPGNPDDEGTQLTRKIRVMKPEIESRQLKIFTLVDQAKWTSSSRRSQSPHKTSNSRSVLVASTQHHSRTPQRELKALVSDSAAARQRLEEVTQTPVHFGKGSQALQFNDREQNFESRVDKNFSYQAANRSPLRAASPEDEPHFMRTMGSPQAEPHAEDDFYDGFDDDDDNEMLDAADAFEQSVMQDSDDRHARQDRNALTEISNNLRREPHSQQEKTAPPAELLKHKWSKDVLGALKKRFHLQNFRHNQLEAINATLSGKDTFVLMPTGGGKSLCYQLPSIVQSGKTQGVTVVISPLLSLMQDQVDHLQKLKIQAFMINSEVTAEHRKLVFSSLKGPNVEQFIQLLYVTPEMLAKSQVMLNTFSDLYNRQKLARIVIDEAHCVSQWGHDFRPDYKNLGAVRSQFPRVPVMALTATATENVKIDTIHNLRMEGCHVFTQSFNRPNLYYEVRPKTKGQQLLKSIAETISEYHGSQSGIVYCLSRKSCESLAEQLRNEHGIRAAHYHAGMPADERARVQKDWQRGKHHVIIATIAFGMGIDKPDVRFVLHHTIPKSLEGYYQETGRAGRDGAPSNCYLYYGYGDTTQLKRMIDQGEGSAEQKERQKLMLRNVVQFCENRSDCRRAQVLAYFNETFSSNDCQDGCDNCKSDAVFEKKDFSSHAKAILDLVRRLHGQKVTVLHCVDVYRGATHKKIQEASHQELPQYGKGKALDRGEVERLVYRLVTEDALEEFNEVNGAGFACQYVKLGPKCRDFISGTKELTFQVRISSARKPRSKAVEKKTSKKQSKGKNIDIESDTDHENHRPTSTIVSSPIEARIKQKGRAKRSRPMVVESEDDNDADFEVFEPVAKAGVTLPGKSRAIGPPITVDKQFSDLDEAHRSVLETFVREARRALNDIAMQKSLRQLPISDSVLREIGLSFPLSEAALLRVKGMDEEKVKRYGPTLLRLIKDAHANYETILQLNTETEEHRADNAIVTISDDESDENFIASSDEDDDGGSPSSHYFVGGNDKAVAAFNAQFSQVPTLTSAGPRESFKKGNNQVRTKAKNTSRQAGASRRQNGAAKGRGSGITKKRGSGGSRSSGGGKTGASFGGKKNAGSKNRSAASASAFGLGMMPT